LTDPRLAGRIASYTSISGPALEHTAAWARRLRDHPLTSARQLLNSYYIGLILLPRLPEAAIRRGLLDRALAAANRRTGSSGSSGTEPAPSRSIDDKINGLELYRANIGSPLARRPRPQQIDIPVCVIAIEDDAYLTPRLCLEAPAPYVRDLHTRTISGGHWVVSREPALVATCLREFVAAL
ncbi:MAG: hypothetical protein QOH17_1523, partial [Pseudonocardiales bacterium]|nr:hypothetical protein [Pseudonocardiales bacterium]